MIQGKFKVQGNAKRYALLKIGDGWKSQIGRLHTNRNEDRMIPLQQLIENVPDGVNPNNWAGFVQYKRIVKRQVCFLINHSLSFV